MMSSAMRAAATRAESSPLVAVSRNTFARVCSSFIDPDIFPLVSAFANLSALDLQKIWDGVHARVIHGDRITLGIVELDAGSHVPEHRHENEQLGMCLSGSLDFRVADETLYLGPGDTWTIPSDVPHEVNVGAEGAVVIDVFVPRREDWQDAERSEQRKLRWPN
jgi:quercetin dioxygenase-like cupin family protein